jgi:NDP-sugar pyrophosphorylase family protein
MKALLLVGGLGTRLRPLTFSIPKPLLPVGEKPILQIIIEQLRHANVDELILATGYQAELIQAFCGDGAKFGVKISYLKEDKPLGTAGPLALIRDHFNEDEYCLLMNGDILTKLDFVRFIETSKSNGCDLTVGYTKYIYRSPFGVLSVKDGMVEAIIEKPSREYLISAGIYCVKESALNWIPDGEFFTVPDLIRCLIDQGKTVGAYHIEEQWMGLESIDHFEEALKQLNGVQDHSEQEIALPV